MGRTTEDKKHTHGGDVQMVESHTIDAPADPNESTAISIIDCIKAHPKVLIYSAMMTTGPLMYGFDSIIVGICTAIPEFQMTYGAFDTATKMYILPSIWLSLWNAMTQLGIMIGCMINGPLTDRFGRRPSFMLGGIIGCLAVAIVFTSDRFDDITSRRGAFLAGKIVLGVALGILTSTCQTYISEIAPPRLRGPLLSIYQFFLVLGQIIGVSIVFTQIVVPHPSAYRIPFASQWAFAGLGMVLAYAVPESPTYLMKRGLVDKARKSFARINHPSTVDASVLSLQATLEHERNMDEASRGIGYLECFRGTNWRRTRIVWYIVVLQQFVGITFVANATYFLELGGMSPTHALVVLGVGVGLGLPANVISWFGMTIFGRRSILLVITLWLAGCWLSIGIAGCFKTSGALWYIGVMLNMIIFFFGLGIGGTYPVVAAETSSLRLRAKTNSLGFLMNGFGSWVFSFFVPYLFNSGSGSANWGGKVGFFFCGLSLIAAVVLYLEVPEMKNRTYRDLDEMFERKVKTRDFPSYICENTPLTTSEFKV